MITIWMFLLPLIAVLLPVWLGQRYGVYVKKKSAEVQEGPLSSAVAATLGLLAFMLGFTFEIVGTRFDNRKELMINEISCIRSTYLYAGLIPEPFRTESKKMLVAYVDMRVEAGRDFRRLQVVKSQSQHILDSLWKFSETMIAMNHKSDADLLFISSVNSLANLFNERINVTFQFYLPRGVLYVLTFVAFFSLLTLGYQFGVSGKVSLLVTLLLGITFAAVMWLIFALDHPEVGLIHISEAPMQSLQEYLHLHQQ